MSDLIEKAKAQGVVAAAKDNLKFVKNVADYWSSSDREIRQECFDEIRKFLSNAEQLWQATQSKPPRAKGRIKYETATTRTARCRIMVSIQNPHILLLSFAVLIAAIAALIHAVKIVHRPVMTDQQWRCYMDSLNPYADKTKPHSCRRCSGFNRGAEHE